MALTCCRGSPCALELVNAPNTSVTPLEKEMVDIFMSLWTFSGITLAASLTKPWANWQELENIWLSCCTFFCKSDMTLPQSGHIALIASWKA